MVMKIPVGRKIVSQKGAQFHLEHMNYLVLNKEIWLSTVGVVFEKKNGAISAKIREHNLEPWFLMNYGTGSVSICSLVGGAVARGIYIYNSELDRGDSWRARFPEMIILSSCEWHLMSLLELTYLGTVSSPPLCCFWAQVGSMGLLLICSILVILHEPSLPST